MLVVPFEKLTVPAGMPVPEFGVTVAVKVTDCPVLLCIGEADKEVVVGTALAARLTVTGDDVEPALLLSPP
jgi:hypothetical protein